ncbi:hypothetical protein, partial [Nocardia sp. NPDC004722]
MPAYTALLTLHITAGTLGLILGPAVALSDTRTRHTPARSHPPRNGDLWRWYLGTLAAVGITATLMVLWRRPQRPTDPQPTPQ